MATKTKAQGPNKANAMATTSPSQFAVAIGHDDGGKKVRRRLRALGTKVSEGGAFGASEKNQLWAIFVEGRQVAKTKKETSGGNAKQRRTKARASKTEAKAPTKK